MSSPNFRLSGGNLGYWTIFNHGERYHHGEVITGAMASQITSLTIFYSTVSGSDQRKYQKSASLAFLWAFHRSQVNSPHRWPPARKMFPFDDVIMSTLLYCGFRRINSWKRFVYYFFSIKFSVWKKHTDGFQIIHRVQYIVAQLSTYILSN